MWVAVAIGAGSLVSAGAQYFSSKAASEAQSDAASAAMAEQQRRYQEAQQMLGPYMEAGKAALGQQQALSGAAGPDAQKAAIAQIQNSPAFQAMQQQGERGILQNASATGGLRGGNVQAALAQFRPQLLSQAINQQYAQLGGLASMGYNAAAGLGQGAMGTGQQIGNYLTQQGQAQAGADLGLGQSIANLGAGLGGAVGQGLMYNQLMGQQATNYAQNSGAAGVGKMNLNLKAF